MSESFTKKYQQTMDYLRERIGEDDYEAFSESFSQSMSRGNYLLKMQEKIILLNQTAQCNCPYLIDGRHDTKCPSFISEAKEVSRKVGYVSVSWLQRQMRIGYMTASSIVDTLVAEGFCIREGGGVFKITPPNMACSGFAASVAREK